jgi:hypothetical protein
MAKKRRRKSVSAIFRRIYQEKPALLASTSNDEVYRRFQQITGKPVNDRQKGIHNNLKSVLRKGDKIHGGRQRTVKQAGDNALEQLEELIDDCMDSAKSIDRDSLASVIQHLRQARKQVILHGAGH